MPAVNHGDGSITLKSCFFSSRDFKSRWRELNNNYKYQSVLVQNIQALTSKLKMKRIFFPFRHISDPNHTSKSTTEWLKRKENECFRTAEGKCRPEFS